MANLTFAVTPAGLAVPAWIGLSGQAMADLQAAGQPIPRPLQTRGLLDTCADWTAVAPWVLQRLGLSRTSQASTQTAAGLVQVNVYEVSLSITDPGLSGAPMLTHANLMVTELPATLPDADVLVGLNVLLELKMLLDGPARRFTLEF